MRASATDYAGAVLQVASSAINISQVFYYYGHAARECVTFTNDAPKQATNVMFVFAWRGETEAQSGDEMMNAQGTFDHGVPTKYSRIENMGGCYDTKYAFKDSTVTVAVAGVRYYDGSLWLAVPPIEGEPVRNGSPVVLGGIEALAGVRAAPVKYPVVDAPMQECATITNDSVRQVRRVVIVFEHRGNVGNLLGQETLNVSDSLAAGSALPLNCEGFYGSTKPSVFHYAQALAQDKTDTTPPLLFYKDAVSTLSAFVEEVDFADGTSWRASSR
jgi:hypothetical protein